MNDDAMNDITTAPTETARHAFRLAARVARAKNCRKFITSALRNARDTCREAGVAIASPDYVLTFWVAARATIEEMIDVPDDYAHLLPAAPTAAPTAEEITKMVRYIKDHGFFARASFAGKIEITYAYTQGDDMGMTTETVTPTWSAVIEWLGY